jgi:hypothetical protein
MKVCRSLTSTAVLALLILASVSLRAQNEQPSDQAPRATFKSAVDLVSIAAVVRDRHGRFAREL